MEIYPGKKYKVNSGTGEQVTVLYVDGKDCLLLRESGNLIRANGFFIKNGYIFWNGGDYYNNDMFKNLMELM